MNTRINNPSELFRHIYIYIYIYIDSLIIYIYIYILLLTGFATSMNIYSNDKFNSGQTEIKLD